MTRIAATLLVFAAMAGCGKTEPPEDPLETAAYKEWKSGQFMRRLPAANFAVMAKGQVEIFPPQERSKNPGDFCELYLNGEKVGRFNTARRPDGTWPVNSFEFEFLSGGNTFDLWDSTSNRYYREHVDTRQCTHFQCVPTADGYEIKWIDRKVPDLDK